MSGTTLTPQQIMAMMQMLGQQQGGQQGTPSLQQQPPNLQQQPPVPQGPTPMAGYIGQPAPQQTYSGMAPSFPYSMSNGSMTAPWTPAPTMAMPKPVPAEPMDSWPQGMSNQQGYIPSQGMQQQWDLLKQWPSWKQQNGHWVPQEPNPGPPMS